MEQRLQNEIKKLKLFNIEGPILIALSGGVDSVVLTHILAQHFTVQLAHANFQLRGKESDADEKFCVALAKKMGLKIHIKRFETKSFAKKHDLSTQMAARDLRYNWFKELMDQEKIEFLATAHHHNDNVETFFLSLVRGTGIKGLKGINFNHENILRPLLNLNKEEIEAYAKLKKLKFRSDSSNNEVNYDRNYIRLKVIPTLTKRFSGFEEVMKRNFKNLQEENRIVYDHLTNLAGRFTAMEGDIFRIDLQYVIKSTIKHSFLHFVLSPYEFNGAQIDQLVSVLEGSEHVGKKFLTQKHVLTVERNQITVRSNHRFSNVEVIDDENSLRKIKDIKITSIARIRNIEKNEIIVDRTMLKYPLVIRTRRTGDKFKPFGMKGFKLLSDFLKDEKLSNAKRDRVKVLINGNGEIVWVMGLRADERYRVTKVKTELLKFKWIEEF